MLGFDAVGRMSLGQISRGAIFLQTISATAAGAVSVVKSAGKIVSVTGAGTVSFIKSVGKFVVPAAVGAVTVLAQYAQTTRKALYLRGASFWKGRP